MATIDVLYGYPGDHFDVLHHVGIAITGLGIFFYIGLLICLYLYGLGTSDEVPFSKWPIPEKLFVHLSLYGALCGSCHLLDQLRIAAMQTQDPDSTCDGFGLIFHTHLLAELLVVLYATLNAVVLYIWKVPVYAGPYDSIWLLVLYLVPLVVSVCLLLPGLMGPTGAWCFIDFSTREGQHYSKILAIITIVIFLVCLLAFIFLTLANFNKKVKVTSYEETNNIHKIQSLLVFTPMCLVHWFMLVLFQLWSQTQHVPYAVVMATTIVVNLGGIYQCIAYGFIRGVLKPPPKDLAAPIRFQLAKIGFDSANIASRMRKFSSETSFQTKATSVATSTTSIDNNTQYPKEVATNKFAGLQYVQDIEI